MENSFSNSNQSGNRGVGFAFILAVALGSCVITDLRAQVIVVPTNSTSWVYDPIVVGQPQRFYRVVLTNCVP